MKNRSGNRFRSTKPCFEGQCPELKGALYDYTKVPNLNQYTKSTDKIASYVGSKLENGMGLMTKFRGMNWNLSWNKNGQRHARKVRRRVSKI